jgi:Flp pilus assembly protein TadB
MSDRRLIAYLLLMAIFAGLAAAAYFVRREQRRRRRRRRHQTPQQINLFVKPGADEVSGSSAQAGLAAGSQPPPSAL